MHLGESVDGKGSWSPEGLHEELNNMTGENVREFVNGTYKIKPSQDNKITNDNNLTIFVEDTQHDSLEKTLQRFEEPDSVLADISSKRHHYHSQVGDSQIVVELLKNRVSSLEKQLIEKNAIIDFLLKEIRTKFFKFSNCVQILSYFWSIFNLNTRKYGPEITPHLDTFQ